MAKVLRNRGGGEGVGQGKKKSLEKYIQGISMMTNAITIWKGFQGCKSSWHLMPRREIKCEKQIYFGY